MDDRPAPTDSRPSATSRRRLLASAGAALSLAGAAGVADATRRPRRGRSARGAGPTRPFPQHTAYAAGTILPSQGRAQLDADVRAAYDRWKSRFLVRVTSRDRRRQSGPPRYRVAFGKPGTANRAITVSEGQGYGMVIVPILAGHDPAAQEIFDGLWRFALQHRSCIDDRLMLWKVPIRNEGCDSATDGDLDIAYGLLLADAQWGSAGAINYKAAATSVLAGVLASTIGPQSRLPLLGDWVEPNGAKENQWTVRTSDFMTGHLRAFGRFTGNAAWNDARQACLDAVTALRQGHAPTTGLLPDFTQPVSATDRALRPADPGFLEGPTDGAYSYNAGRDPWRLGTDGLLNGEAAALAAVSRMSRWIESATGGDPRRIRAGYRLDGTPLPDSDFFTSFFAAPFAVAAMAVPERRARLGNLDAGVAGASED